MDQSILSSRAVIGMYYEALAAAAGLGWVGNVSNYFGSDQASEVYPWLGMPPALREWIGGRQAKGLSTNMVEIRNKHFEATLQIELKDLRRDKTGQHLDEHLLALGVLEKQADGVAHIDELLP